MSRTVPVPYHKGYWIRHQLQKKGLTELIGLVYSGEAERIVVNYKDRLVRFGYEMLEEICRLNDVEDRDHQLHL